MKFADRDARVRQHIACEYRTFLHQVRRFCHAPAFFVDGAFEENFVIRRYFRAEALEDLLFFPSGHAARQVFRKRTVLVQHFELEKSGVLDKRLGPARILDARKLYDDLPKPLLLNQRFGYPELVDAVADRFECLAHRLFFNALCFVRFYRKYQYPVAGGVGGEGGELIVGELQDGVLPLR